MSKTMIMLILCAGAAMSPAMGADPAALAKAKQCFTCHAAKSELIGPSFSDIARRFKGVSNAESMLAGVIQAGSDRPGVVYHWGTTKMPTASARVPVSKEEAAVLAKYVLSFE
jgi:cytochrome c